MSVNYLSIQTSVLALLRGDLKASYIADRFGVTETQVLEWQDTFVAAGVLALNESLSGSRGGARKKGQPVGRGRSVELTTESMPSVELTTESMP